MTHHQRRLYRFLVAELARTDGVTPSYQEMADHLGLAAKSGIARLVLALEERGLVRRVPNKARSIELCSRPAADTTDLTAATDAALLAEAARRGLVQVAHV